MKHVRQDYLLINFVVSRDVNAAIDYVFDNNVLADSTNSFSGISGGSYSEQKARALFDGFKTQDETGQEIMDQDGIESFMTQIGVDAQADIVVVVISQYMAAEYMGEYKWSEFNKGCKALNCDSIASWKTITSKLRQEVQNDAKFAEMYKFAFGFAKEKDKRNVDCELACALWDLLIGSKCQFLTQWKAFVMGKKERGEQLVVTRDTWDLFYDLIKQTNGNIANFVDDGAWPSMIDQFVESLNGQ